MEKLIMLREERQLTQEEASKLIGCNHSSLCQWESGRRWPNARFLPSIARVYGVTIAELFTEKELNVKPYDM